MKKREEDIFSYGDIVTGDLFVSRNRLVSTLQAHIKSCQATIIYGYRKVGKSSLIHEAIRRYKQSKKKDKIACLILDVSKATNSKQFISLLCKEINKLIDSIEPIKRQFNKISNLITTIRPVAKINSITGELEQTIDFIGRPEQIPETICEALRLLNSIAEKHKVIVVFDEFHVIAKWRDSNIIQWNIRSEIQLQKNIMYFFSGSSRKLIKKLFMETQSALYKSGALIHVDNFIPMEEFAPWIKERFYSHRFNLLGEALKHIFDVTRSHPYYTQKLCHNIWSNIFTDKQKKEITSNEVVEAIKILVTNEEFIYKERLEKLTNNQQNTLKAIAKLNEAGTTPSLKEICNYTSISKATTQSTLNALDDKEYQLIYKEGKHYAIEDPFFELWLQS